MKKLLLSLGSVAAIVAPVASVIACGHTAAPKASALEQAKATLIQHTKNITKDETSKINGAKTLAELTAVSTSITQARLDAAIPTDMKSRVIEVKADTGIEIANFNQSTETLFIKDGDQEFTLLIGTKEVTFKLDKPVDHTKTDYKLTVDGKPATMADYNGKVKVAFTANRAGWMQGDSTSTNVLLIHGATGVVKTHQEYSIAMFVVTGTFGYANNHYGTFAAADSAYNIWTELHKAQPSGIITPEKIAKIKEFVKSLKLPATIEAEYESALPILA